MIKNRIAELEHRLALTFEEYKEKHPGTHKSPADFMAKTKSGKPIYTHFDHPGHNNFNFNDHIDASNAHMEEAKHEDKGHHHQQAKHHTQEAEKQILSELTLAGE